MRLLKICILSLSLPVLGFSFEKLDEKYLILFGDTQAPIKIIQYFSMTCPHCLEMFKKDFKVIKEKYLDTNKVAWTFHPVPLDSLTIQMMDCLSKLNLKQKRILLEALLDTVQVQDNAEVVLFLMKEAMITFNCPMSDLDDEKYIIKTQSFLDAYNFIRQEDRIEAVPAVECDGVLYRKDIPNQSFIEKKVLWRTSL